MAVSTRKRSARSRGEVSGRFRRERSNAPVEGIEVRECAGGLGEVVAGDLVQLELAGRIGDRPGGTLVKLRARKLWEPCVGGVADEDVAEAPLGLTLVPLRARADELLALELPEESLEVADLTGVDERADRLDREHLADDGGPLDDEPLRARQPVEARRQQSADRRGHRNSARILRNPPAVVLPNEDLLVDQHPQELLDEQRVALGGGGDSVA